VCALFRADTQVCPYGDMAINYALALYIIYHHISPEFPLTSIWAAGYRGGIVGCVFLGRIHGSFTHPATSLTHVGAHLRVRPV